MDETDSKKRPLDEESDQPAKRSNYDMSTEVQFKLLIPNSMAGAVIGKGGEMIAKLQEQNGCRIKMSKGYDYYPGTQERICLLTGTSEQIMAVLNFIVHTVHDKVDSGGSFPDAYDVKNSERRKEMKLLVPNSTVGMIIGKSGAYIREIRERTGAYLEVSRRSENERLPERVVTFAGSPDQLLDAAELVLEKIAEDKNSAAYPNTSYSDIVAAMQMDMGPPPPGMGPPGRPGGPPPEHPFLQPPGGPPMHMGGPMSGPPRGDHPMPGNYGPPSGPSHGNMLVGGPPNRYDGGGPGMDMMPPMSAGGSRLGAGTDSMCPTGSYGAMNSVSTVSHAGSGSGGLGVLGGRVESAARSSGAGTTGLAHILDSLEQTLRSLGFSNSAILEIGSALSILSKYNVLGLGLGQLMSANAASAHATPMDGAGVSAAIAASISATTAGYQVRSVPSTAYDNPEPTFVAAASTRRYHEFPSEGGTGAGFLNGSSGANMAGAPPSSSYRDNPSSGGFNPSGSSGSTPTRYLSASAGERFMGSPMRSGSYDSMGVDSGYIGRTAIDRDPHHSGASGVPSMMLEGGGSSRDLSAGQNIVDVEIDVPENLVGVILGKQGKTLGELQTMSGAKVEVSGRGVFAPGTNNRIVTISGPSNCVDVAKRLVYRRLADEKTRRDHNPPRI